MIKLILQNGLTAYKTTAVEITAIGGLGICDECNAHSDEGYLIPVLNHWMCPTCFKDWSSRCKHYEEDEGFEHRNMLYYEKMIPLDDSIQSITFWSEPCIRLCCANGMYYSSNYRLIFRDGAVCEIRDLTHEDHSTCIEVKLIVPDHVYLYVRDDDAHISNTSFTEEHREYIAAIENALGYYVPVMKGGD